MKDDIKKMVSWVGQGFVTDLVLAGEEILPRFNFALMGARLCAHKRILSEYQDWVFCKRFDH